jgi:hypothetical protein
MTSERSPRRRLHIERLELDLRGVAPATAEATAQALGPALARALAVDAGDIAAKKRIDAGRIATRATPEPGALANRIAQRIAASLRRERS